MLPSTDSIDLSQFQDISSKLDLQEAIIRPTVLYGSEIWGPSLLQTDWARTDRVHTIPRFSGASSDANAQFNSPFFRRSSKPTPFASRSSFVWSISYVE